MSVMVKRKIDKVAIVNEPGSENLVFSYECNTERVSFSISDIGGAVCLKGRLKKDVNRVNIDSLSKGIYLFCIIDGDQLTQVKFKKA
jgi:hypothetical protein